MRLNSHYFNVILIQKNLLDFSGQGLIEYALIILLIAIVVIAALGLLGTELNTAYQFIVDSLPT